MRLIRVVNSVFRKEKFDNNDKMGGQKDIISKIKIKNYFGVKGWGKLIMIRGKISVNVIF